MPNDEQISRIKKELDLLKMQQELEAIKRTRGQTPANYYETQTPQTQDRQIPTNYYEAQIPQITQDSRFGEVNQSNYQGTYNVPNRNYNGSPEDRSGLFLGVEVGYGEQKMSLSMTTPVSVEGYQKKGGVNWGIMLGYSNFFVNHFGMRVYASANAQIVRFPKYWNGIQVWYNPNVMSIAWGGNFDLLVNFVALRNFDFGFYVGVFVGANSFINRDLYDLEDRGFYLDYTLFDVAVNVGLRTMIARHFGIEIAARFPFLESNILDKAASVSLITNTQGTTSISSKQKFSVNARFLYKF